MTLPRLPGIIPIDGSAAISGVCIHKDTLVQNTHTQTEKHARAYKYTKLHALPQTSIQK